MSHYTPVYEKGEVVAVRTPALDPFKQNKSTVTGLVGTAQAFAPGKDPENVPGDRASPDITAQFEYRAGVGYVAFIETATLDVAGVWTIRVHLYEETGGYGNVEYANFELKL